MGLHLHHQLKEHQHQAGVGIPSPAQAALAFELLPEGSLRIDVDARRLAGHAGALLAAIGLERSAGRLTGFAAAPQMGRAAKGSPLARDHGLHRAHGAEVLAPGFAPVGPTHQQRCCDGDQQQRSQANRRGIHRQQAQAEPCDQQAPLQLDVMAAEPGIGVDFHDHRFALFVEHLTLPAEMAKQLREEGQWADASPQLMAQHHQHQQR